MFQKAYVEFFVSPELFQRLLPAFQRHPTLTYHAINAAGAGACIVLASEHGCCHRCHRCLLEYELPWCCADESLRVQAWSIATLRRSVPTL